MKKTFITTMMCLEILENYIPDITIVNTSVINHRLISDSLKSNDTRYVNYIINIDVIDDKTEEFYKNIGKAKQAIHRCLCCEESPIQQNKVSAKGLNINTIVVFVN